LVNFCENVCYHCIRQNKASGKKTRSSSGAHPVHLTEKELDADVYRKLSMSKMYMFLNVPDIRVSSTSSEAAEVAERNEVYAEVCPHTLRFNGHFPGEPLAGCPLNPPSPFIPEVCILLGQAWTFHVILNTIPPGLFWASSLSSISHVIQRLTPFFVFFCQNITKSSCNWSS